MRRALAFGLIVASLVAPGLRSAGAAPALPGAAPGEPATLAGPVAAALTLAAPPAPAPVWPDMADHWARYDAEVLRARAAVVIPVEEPFLPDHICTRGDFLKMQAIAVGLADAAQTLATVPSSFADVPAADPLNGYLEAAYEVGLTVGFEDRTFRPDAELTRAQMVAFLLRALGLEGEALSPVWAAAPLDAFADGKSAPAWARGYLALAAEAGLIRGYADGTLGAMRPATRAEAAAFLVRALALSGRSSDLRGMIEAVSPDTRVLVVSVDGWRRPEVVELAPNAAVYRNGRPEPLAALHVLDEISVILDAAGWATLVEAVSTERVGELAAVDAAHDRLLLSLGPGLQTAEVVVEAGAAVFLSGRAAALEALRPGDQLYLVLSSRTGRARLVDAVRVHVDGFARAVKDAAAITVVTAAGARDLVGAPGAMIFRNGRPSALTAVSAGDRVRVTLGADGRFTFLEATGAAGAAVEQPVAARAARLLLAMESEGQALPLDPPAAAASNRRDLKLDKLAEATPADGSGVTIAVIDTGADPSHPLLTQTSGWERKIIDYQDFSGEGNVDTSASGRATRGTVETSFGILTVGRIRSVSGRFHHGLLREGQLDKNSPLGRDLNRNGVDRDAFPILVVDSREAGVYDTVYVDTNRDFRFTDEVPMQVYRQAPLVNFLGVDNPSTALVESTAFVVTRIDRDGSGVNIGFDGNGHGTQVAGLAAGFGRFARLPDGVAPGARLMILKALGSSGDGSWPAISRALLYAADNGANVVTLSVATIGDRSAGTSPESRLLRELAVKRGLTIIVAAGNDGPGLASAATPGAPEAITVGASYSPGMWETLYGFIVPEEGPWHFSSVGPRYDGSLAPDVLAPGGAVAPAPAWGHEGGFTLQEGTSVAVPHVAGVAALLLDAARREAIPCTPADLRAAIVQGARALRGYTFVEQGFGVVDARAAWDTLRRRCGRGRRCDRGVSAGCGPCAAWTGARHLLARPGDDGVCVSHRLRT
jgi:tripeptidyl-peptidase-2